MLSVTNEIPELPQTTEIKPNFYFAFWLISAIFYQWFTDTIIATLQTQ